MTPFQHGGNIASFAKACGCQPDEVIDLSSNINFVAPYIDIDFSTLPIAPYPDYTELYERLANYMGVSADQMEVFNGGSSAIFSLYASFDAQFAERFLDSSRFHSIARAVANTVGAPSGLGAPWSPSSETSVHKRLNVIYAPAYLEYKKAAERFGFEVHLIDRFSQMDAEVPEGSLVVFVNPATPDGAWYDMEPYLKRWAEWGCTVLVDESFLAFTSHSSVSRYLDRYPNLYILTSMTKYFGAAGMRIGVLVSSADNIATLRQREPLWKLSAFDAAYLLAALEDETFVARSESANREAKTWLLDVLESSPWVETIYPGEANFVLVRLRGMRAEELQKRLLPHRVLVRDCANFDGLDAHHVRIAVKAIEQMEPLAEVLGG